MKLMNLLIWVGQFGFSIIFPTLFFLFCASWLRDTFELGWWIMAVFGILGVLTSLSTAKSCLKSLLKAVEDLSKKDDPPVSFNNHT